MNGITVQITDGIIEINIDTTIAIDTKAVMKMQTLEGWETGLNRAVTRVLDPMTLKIQKELEHAFHQAVIRGEIDYKADK